MAVLDIKAGDGPALLELLERSWTSLLAILLVVASVSVGRNTKLSDLQITNMIDMIAILGFCSLLLEHSMHSKLKLNLLNIANHALAISMDFAERQSDNQRRRSGVSAFSAP